MKLNNFIILHSHFSFISQQPFTKTVRIDRAVSSRRWQLLNVKLLKTANYQMLNAFGGGIR